MNEITINAIRQSILELSDSIEKETINRRRDTLDLLSTIAGVEERFAGSINALTERVAVLEIDNQATQMFINEQEDKDIVPVLNDGKATSNPGGQLPFVTGLSVEKPTREELIIKYVDKLVKIDLMGNYPLTFQYALSDFYDEILNTTVDSYKK